MGCRWQRTTETQMIMGAFAGNDVDILHCAIQDAEASSLSSRCYANIGLGPNLLKRRQMSDSHSRVENASQYKGQQDTADIEHAPQPQPQSEQTQVYSDHSEREDSDSKHVERLMEEELACKAGNTEDSIETHLSETVNSASSNPVPPAQPTSRNPPASQNTADPGEGGASSMHTSIPLSQKTRNHKDKVWKAMVHHLGGKGKVLQINVTNHEAKELKMLWECTKHTVNCCEISAFHIHLLSTPACAWNKSSVAVLTRYLAVEWKYRDDDYTGRKLWDSHQNMTFDIPELENQREALDSLGVKGMSSDEKTEEIGTGWVTYTIKPPAWHSISMTNWLWFFDEVYRYKHLSNTIRVTHGNAPRVHVPGPGFSSNKLFPSHLPKNTYQPEWLKLRTSADLSINVQPLPTKPDLYKHNEEYVVSIPA
ncbi:hypothetical protein F5146DRAFT_1006718 [Armillaria mellea]|nr:hypothetical protein F5146DRAFT_1006718 [Armillaria mellea]